MCVFKYIYSIYMRVCKYIYLYVYSLYICASINVLKINVCIYIYMLCLYLFIYIYIYFSWMCIYIYIYSSIECLYIYICTLNLNIYTHTHTRRDRSVCVCLKCSSGISNKLVYGSGKIPNWQRSNWIVKSFIPFFDQKEPLAGKTNDVSINHLPVTLFGKCFAKSRLISAKVTRFFHITMPLHKTFASSCLQSLSLSCPPAFILSQGQFSLSLFLHWSGSSYFPSSILYTVNSLIVFS